MNVPYKLITTDMTPPLSAGRSRLPRKATQDLRQDEGARPHQLRETNNLLLLRILRENSPCSKADMVRRSGLSAPTVSAAVAELSELGLVESLGEGKSWGGRPPGLLRFNASHSFVAGADIGGTYLRMMLADLEGKAVATWSARMAASQKTPTAVVSLMQQGLQEMTVRADAHNRVRHITIGAPGITDVQRGVVKAAPNLKDWIHVPLKELVEANLHVSATVENDVNLAAVGERSQGIAKYSSDFIFIAIGTGVGAGIYVQGELHRGSTWSAGEIGYLPVIGMARERMLLDKTGQLESVIGGAGVESAWKSLLQREGIEDAALLKLRATHIFDLAGEGNAIAKEIVVSTARILADAIGILGLLYDPQMVVLGGGVGSHELLRAATEAFLHENQLALPEVRISTLGKEAQLFGAIALSLAAIEAGLLS